MAQGFPEKAKEELKHYVYVYIDPRTKKPFYIGKGQGDRAFSHLDDKSESEKVRKIEEIRKSHKQPEIKILTYGLDAETALKVEAAAIDLVGVDKLTNQKRGNDTHQYGKVDAYEFAARYQKKLLEEDITENVMIIRINKLYRYDLTEDELYNATRAYWIVNKENADQVDYVFSVYKNRILEVYKVAKWFDAGTTYMPVRRGDEGEADYEWLREHGRKEFVGQIADEEIRNKYKDKSVEDIFPFGSENPIKYVWGKEQLIEED